MLSEIDQAMLLPLRLAAEPATDNALCQFSRSFVELERPQATARAMNKARMAQVCSVKILSASAELSRRPSR